MQIRSISVQNNSIHDHAYAFRPYELPDDFPFMCRNRYIMPDKPAEEIHSHNSLEIGYCHEGSGIFAVGSKIIPFASGDISIITSQEIHFAQSSKGTNSIWFFLFLDLNRLIAPHYPEWATFDMMKYSGLDFNNIFIQKKYPRLCQVVEVIIEEAINRKEKDKVLITSLLTQFAIYLSRIELTNKEHVGQLNPRTIVRLKNAIKYIASHYDEKITIETLADLSFMSLSTFARLFKKILRKSPQQFILEMRFAKACIQLKNTNDPINRIPLDNGFPTVYSFNRKSKHELGLPRREWRIK